MSGKPVIIEAAVNGTTQPGRNPPVPRTPEEITADAIACLEAGASIVHSHTDDPVLDMVTPAHDPTPYIDAWRPVLECFPDALLYPTMTGGGPHTTIEQRYGHISAIAEAGVLTMGIVDPGSVNIGWLDPDGRPAPTDIVYINSMADIRYMFDTCAGLGVPVNVSIFDGSFMRTAIAYARAGGMPHGATIKIFFGTDTGPFGIPATRAGLDVYLDILGECTLPWSVALPGSDILTSEAGLLALERGGHLRVGLEDYGGAGHPTNVELVERAVEVAARFGRQPATPTETRKRLVGA
jgi:3-keto-5-aminohexanoate cleavage enzyme